MEDLFEKFYGKPESEGGSDSPPGEPNDRLAQVEQRIGRVESQLLQIAKVQQTFLTRLDTMIEQQGSQLSPPPEPQHAPPPVPPKVWRPAWTEPRPEPPPEPQHEWQSDPEESIPDGDGTPIIWDPVNQRLHTMDDPSDDDPYAHESSEDLSDEGHGPRELQSRKTGTRTCTVCGCQFPAAKGKMGRHNQYCPETLHCPQCYEKLMDQRKFQMFVLGIVIAAVVIVGSILLAATAGR